MSDEVKSNISASGANEVAPNTPNSDGGVDRRDIRKRRKAAAKAGKKLARAKYDAVLEARPVGSRPADQMLSRAVALYQNGPIDRRNLWAAAKRLRMALSQELPDHMAFQPARSVSARPSSAGLMIYETRAAGEPADRILSAENHSVVLEEDRITFISGLLPGGMRPHLFERLHERDVRRRTMAEVAMQMSSVWPTLLWMRARQRLAGRGNPISVTITPFAEGLLFGRIEKVEGLPPAGPTVAVIDQLGQQSRELRDSFGDGGGNRVWVMTNTFVDSILLGDDQRELHKLLNRFVQTYPDVVQANDWRWRIGLGDDDPAVATIAKAFRIRMPTDARFATALADLENIVASPAWQSVATATEASQRRTG